MEKALFSKTGDFAHHAYLITGERENSKNLVLQSLRKVKDISTEGNPDVMFFEADSLGIDESRAVSQAQLRKPVGDYNFIFISFRTATVEAQNSLLKVLEDPSGHTIFFLLTANESALLSTLLSRLNKVVIVSEQDNPEKVYKKFLSSSAAERLLFVKEIIENKDKKEALNLLASIEKDLRGHWKKGGQKEELTFALKEIVKTRGYINDRASSLKVLLENIALIVPQFS